MTETQLLEAVRELARIRGWLTYHTHRSDHSESGWPDLVCVHPRTGDLVVAELKSAKGKVTAAQQEWIDALAVAGITVHVWRPADLTGAVVAALTPSDVARAHAELAVAR